MKVAVIGGGAGGFFASFSVKQHHPLSEVTIFEKTAKLLSKVKVSGGGRCNVTHHELDSKKLAANYPRGEKFLRKAFSQFAVTDTILWFEKRGVELKTEADNRMFPVTDSSQTIIDTFLKEAENKGIRIQTNLALTRLSTNGSGWDAGFSNGDTRYFDAVVVAIGGQKSIERFDLFSQLGHQIEKPVPSLFTFNIPNRLITQLMGLSVPDAMVRVQGTKLYASGPLLITHWGMSGPAILKLSSLAARELALCNYRFTLQVNWLGSQKEDEVRQQLFNFVSGSGKKLLNKNPFGIPARLWLHFLKELGISQSGTWNSLDKKSKNRIVNKLLNDTYDVAHKTTFKEEFVICGGISLSCIHARTMESKVAQNLFFAGEVLDIDGITGGFNFQAAWTTGFIAGKLNFCKV